MTTLPRRRFISSLIVSIGIPCIFTIIEATNLEDSPWGLLFDVFAWPLMLLIWAISMALITVACAADIGLTKRWHSKYLALAIPVAVVLACAHYESPFGGWYAVKYAGDAIRFSFLKASYDREVTALPSSPSRLKLFDWGGALLIAWRGVVYDEADQVALPKEQRSVSWQSRANEELGGLCEAQPLWDHYYIAGFGC